MRVLLVVALAVGACAGDEGIEGSTAPEGESGDAPSTTQTEPAADAPPSLTLTVESLTGYPGYIVVAVMTPAGGPGGPIGSACLLVTGDPFSGSDVFSTFAPDNPCGKDAPYGAVIDGPGNYVVTVGVLIPGEQSPAACLEAPVTVIGATELTVAGPQFGTDC
jgi:hypothetical protein